MGEALATLLVSDFVVKPRRLNNWRAGATGLKKKPVLALSFTVKEYPARGVPRLRSERACQPRCCSVVPPIKCLRRADRFRRSLGGACGCDAVGQDLFREFTIATCVLSTADFTQRSA